MLAVVAMGSAGEGGRQRQIARLRKIAQKAPDNQEAAYLLALLLGSSGDIDGQVEALKNASGAPVQKAKGIAMALKGSAEEAQQELLTAAESEGDGGDMAAAIGFAVCLAGKAEQGEQRLKQALNTNTTVPGKVLLRLGLLMVQQGRFEEAEQYFAQLLAENRNDMAAQYYHAVSLHARGLNEEALREYNTVAQQPKSPFAGEASVRAAEMQLAQNNTAPARDLIEKTISAGVNTAAIYVLRGRAMLQAGEDAKARDSFKRAMELDPNYAPAYLENALMFIKQQLFNEAIQGLEKYLAVAPADAPATRAPEVKMLLDQLRQATGRTDAESAGGAASRSM
jgi:tetratricopeptide (TPR) repeat protein